MIAELWLFYGVALTLVTVPALFARRFRRNLRRADALLFVVPFLVWVALAFTNLRLKGLTDAESELAIVALVTGIALVARTMLPERKVAAQPLIPSVIAAALLWALKPPFLHSDLVAAHLYVIRHPETPPQIREAIVGGVVMEGMSAEQAAVAGGPSSCWTTTNGKLTRLAFNNLTQFRSDRPIPFNVYFVDDRVREIERPTDVDLCRDFIRNPKPESINYPYAGFWKSDCADNFGLRFERGGSGLYGIHFCGPGGCGDISECTPIPDGRNYEVVDANTVLLVRRSDTYKFCEPQTAPQRN